MDFEQLSSITKDTCISYGVSLSDLVGVVNAVSDFCEAHNDMRKRKSQRILCGAFSGGIQGRARKQNALNVRKCQSF